MGKGKLPVLAFYQSHNQRADQRGGDTAPVEPHLAIRIDDTHIAPIPPGVRMFIVRDPGRVDGVFELVFEKIKFKQNTPIELHFKVPDQKGTRKCVMTIAWMGRYDSWLQQEQAQMAQREAEKRQHPNPECKACAGLGSVTTGDVRGGADQKPCDKCWT